jgi:hypothetical protein
MFKILSLEERVASIIEVMTYCLWIYSHPLVCILFDFCWSWSRLSIAKVREANEKTDNFQTRSTHTGTNTCHRCR